MKRFWLVLLSLGLIAAFSTQAMAVDMKISGEYYAAGMYLDKTTLHKNTSTVPWISSSSNPLGVPSTVNPGPSTAFYYQRLRLNGVFTVSPGLTLVTRADVMERVWGAARSAPAGGMGALQANPNYALSAGTNAENENIAFDLAYLSYVSPIGAFFAGYQIDQVWGTVFGDNSVPTGKLSYAIRLGGWTGAFQMGKISQLNSLMGTAGEQSNPRGQIVSALGGALILANGNNSADADTNFYNLANYYTWKNGEAGLLLRYNRIAGTRAIDLTAVEAVVGAAGYKIPEIRETTINLYIMVPYFKAQLGPVALEGELHHVFGQWKPEVAGYGDTRVDVLNAYLNAQADFGKFYAGGTLAYLSGNDPSSNAVKQGYLDGGFDWNPCLIMWNQERTQRAGSLNGYSVQNTVLSNTTATLDSPMNNAWFFQARGGVRPVEKLDIGMSISYANAVVKPSVDWLYNDYGWEVDLTGTYKVTNNLTYMLGGAYLFTGKFFKANNEANEIQDDYMLLNKLTLTF
jgi:hypothetical protein